MEITTFLNHFADILDDTDAALITAGTIFRDLEEWDSLTALSLIAMSDEEYSVKLTGEDIKNAVTVADIFEKIKETILSSTAISKREKKELVSKVEPICKHQEELLNYLNDLPSHRFKHIIKHIPKASDITNT
jgi:acyl carrier protein